MNKWRLNLAILTGFLFTARLPKMHLQSCRLSTLHPLSILWNSTRMCLRQKPGMSVSLLSFMKFCIHRICKTKLKILHLHWHIFENNRGFIPLCQNVTAMDSLAAPKGELHKKSAGCFSSNCPLKFGPLTKSAKREGQNSLCTKLDVCSFVPRLLFFQT